MRWAGLTLAVMTLSYALMTEKVLAHPAQFTTLQVTVDANGQFQASMNVDILAFALGETSIDATNEEMQALLDGPRSVLAQQLADAGDRFKRELVVKTDVGNVTPTSWNLPDLAEVNAVLARKIQPPIVMPGEIDFSGTLPARARTVSIRLPFVMGDTVQVYELANGDSAAEQASAGGYCPKVKLPSPAAPVRVAAPASPPGETMRRALGYALLVIGLFLIANWVITLRRKRGSEIRDK